MTNDSKPEISGFCDPVLHDYLTEDYDIGQQYNEDKEEENLFESPSKNEEVNNTIAVEDIMVSKEQSEKMYSCELINNQCIVVYYVENILAGTNARTYVSRSVERTEKSDNKMLLSDFTLKKFNFVMDALKWISMVSEILARRIGQQIFYYNPSNPEIVRSFYEFCPNDINCVKYYWNLDEESTCNKQHFVHNLVKLDVDSIIVYFENKKYDNINDNDFYNLKKSITTIFFSICKMNQAMKILEWYTKGADKSEVYHRKNKYEVKLTPHRIAQLEQSLTNMPQELKERKYKNVQEFVKKRPEKKNSFDSIFDKKK